MRKMSTIYHMQIDVAVVDTIVWNMQRGAHWNDGKTGKYASISKIVLHMSIFYIYARTNVWTTNGTLHS